MATKLVRVAATGTVVTGKCWLKGILLMGGSAASTVEVRDNTAGSGTVIASLAAVIGSSESWETGDSEGVWITTGIHATLTGAGAAATFEVEV